MSRHCDNCETEIISNTEFYSIAVYSVVDEPTKGGEVKHLDEVDELCWRCGEELFSLAGLHPFTKGKITKTQEEPDSPLGTDSKNQRLVDDIIDGIIDISQ